jgi:hypothetical protein
MIQKAIFLHSSWRSASTYVWAKFRQRSDTYCYFEPLNEHLAVLTDELIDRFRPWAFAHHPPLDAPYLEEFRSLIGPKGGIASFPAHLTFGRYCADWDDHLPELESYLADLAGLAARYDRIPVYGCVRTDMRVRWFRARMPGAHIFIRREPRRQFLSMLRQAAMGNPYFLQRGLVILRHNLTEPAFAPLLSAIDLPALPASSELPGAFRDGLAPGPLLDRLYAIFYYMRLLARQFGELQCDLVIDIDRLSLEADYRRETETRLGDLTGMDISFADCRVERYETNLDWSDPCFNLLERDIESLGMAVIGE